MSKTAVAVDSIESLLSYRSIRELSSRGLLLVWDYLIYFPKKKAPEKQTIEVNIRATPFINDNSTTGEGTRTGYPQESGISVAIKYTERTWAEDILALLSSHFEGKIAQRSKMKRFFLHYHDFTAITVGVVTYALMVGGVFRATWTLAARNAEAARNILDSISRADEQTSAGVAYIIQLQTEGVWVLHFLKMGTVLLVGLPVVIFLGGWVSDSIYSLYSSEPKFLLFPHDSSKARLFYQEYLNGSTRRTLTPIIVSLLVGVVSNLIAALLI